MAKKNQPVQQYYPARGNYQSDVQWNDVRLLYDIAYGKAPGGLRPAPKAGDPPPPGGAVNTKLGGFFMKAVQPSTGHIPMFDATQSQYVPTTAGGSSVPATSSSPGTQGQIATDGSFIYIATGPNTWKRASLSSF